MITLSQETVVGTETPTADGAFRDIALCHYTDYSQPPAYKAALDVRTTGAKKLVGDKLKVELSQQFANQSLPGKDTDPVERSQQFANQSLPGKDTDHVEPRKNLMKDNVDEFRVCNNPNHHESSVTEILANSKLTHAEIGIKCREISGHSRGSEYSNGLSFHRTKSNHMWNALELDDQWYLLDACWGAGTVNLQEKIFVPSYDDFFFFTDPENFIETHWPDDPIWQLLKSPVSFQAFEQNVFKTSEFFKLCLSVISPKDFYLKTDHGQVQVSLGCSKPMEFSYKIYNLSNNERHLVEKMYGILTMHHLSMTLRVIPPVEGLFELMIFARPMDNKDIYKWVCSYQIDCTQAKCSDLLIGNPFHFWGLHQNAKDFGVSGYNYEEDLIVASSSLSVIFKTLRPLLAMYELVHKKLTGPLSKKCFVSHIEETQLSCHLLFPYLGYYRLSLFVKDVNREHYKNAANLLIQCTNPINHNELYPSDLSIHCGPGLNSKVNGLKDPSHLHPVINTTSGACTISFHTSSATELLATLEENKGKTNLSSLDRYCLVTHLEHKISVSLHLPLSGYYKLSIFAKSQGKSQEFSHVCDYVIRCFADTQLLPFPKVYSGWRQGCILLHPRAGLLEAESWETFRVKIPGAYKVVVIGPKKTELQLIQNKIWEGKVFTGSPGSLIKLAVKLAQHSTTMDIMMSFKSQTNPNNIDGSSG
ncbi:Hypothetical predicted protein [Pelobates cultripes]|uniref:KY-like immunoglobulin-like domain-containing protein n=1 Tax=Pelobates cultripes TaxID=61616 RepID=A0AAD1WCX4_PELCU|nr:Hypothetical predicted protein [Pelobates cultripes]